MKTTFNCLFLDIETNSSIDIKHGLKAYTSCPDFKVLCGVIYDQAVDMTLVFDKTSKENIKNINRYISDAGKSSPVHVVAHNVAFEATCLKFSRSVKAIDTALLSRMIGGPSSLEECSKLYLKKNLKNTEGWKLGLLCSGPYSSYNQSEAFKNLVEYCKSDVDIMVQLFKRLSSIFNEFDSSVFDENRFLMDTVNIYNKGFRVDTKYSQFLMLAAQTAKERSEAYFNKIDLNPRSNKQLLEYVKCKFGDNLLRLFCSNLEEVLNDSKNPKYSFSEQQIKRAGREAKRIGNSELVDFCNRKLLVLPSIMNKFKDLKENPRFQNGKFYSSIQHFGTATGRLASHDGFNILNFPRGSRKELIEKKDIKYFQKEPLTEVKKTLRSSMRGAIIPDKGHKFLIADFSSIEPRLVSYFTGSELEGAYDPIGKTAFGKDFNEDVRTIVKIAVMSIFFGKGFGAVCEDVRNMFYAIEKDPSLETIKQKANHIISQTHQTWPKVSELEEHLEANFKTQPSNNKRYSLCSIQPKKDFLFPYATLNTELFGSMKRLRCNQTLEPVKYLKSLERLCPVKLNKKTGRINRFCYLAAFIQGTAGFIHKNFRSLLLDNNVDVIFDVHDETDSQFPIKHEKETVEKFENLSSEFCDIYRKKAGLELKINYKIARSYEK